eukprot:6560190-Pyramimonas_sp.AAC.1
MCKAQDTARASIRAPRLGSAMAPKGAPKPTIDRAMLQAVWQLHIPKASCNHSCSISSHFLSHPVLSSATPSKRGRVGE